MGQLPKFSTENEDLIDWTIYSATTFLESCRKVVREKWFEKSGSRNLVREKWLTRKKKSEFEEPLF